MGAMCLVQIYLVSHREDWGIEDPTGESEEVFRQTRDVIFQKMEHLVNRLKHNEI